MYFYYLAYGSNLHPTRLKERVSSAQEIGVLTIPDRAVRFHKLSEKDRSAKCDLLEVNGSTAHGVLYQIDSKQKALLDRIEGKGNGYREVQFELSVDQKAYLAISFIANSSHIDPSLSPYDWYRD